MNMIVTGLVILLKLDSNVNCSARAKDNRAPFLYYVKLCASFQIHRWIQTGFIVPKRSIWVKICYFFIPCILEIWWMTLKNNRAPFLCYFKLWALFRSHRWIQIGVTVRRRTIWVKIDDFLCRVTLKFDGWPWKNDRAPLLSHIKLCAPIAICEIKVG